MRIGGDVDRTDHRAGSSPREHEASWKRLFRQPGRFGGAALFDLPRGGFHREPGAVNAVVMSPGSGAGAAWSIHEVGDASCS